MDVSTANILNRTTQAFYATQAESFSATRQSAWPGWRRVLADTRWKDDVAFAAHDRQPVVVDVACGNLRFKNFLHEEMPDTRFEYHALDTCASLAGTPAGASFSHCDIVSALANDASHVLPDCFERCADLTVCFGFFHHVPGVVARKRLLRALCAATRLGGVVAISLWRFMDDPTLAKKARQSHAAALRHFSDQGERLDLDEGDYLLGWQQAQGVFRYCHHFTDDEVGELAASVHDVAGLIDRFRSDGRTGDLNEYLIFHVKR